MIICIAGGCLYVQINLHRPEAPTESQVPGQGVVPVRAFMDAQCTDSVAS